MKRRVIALLPTSLAAVIACGAVACARAPVAAPGSLQGVVHVTIESPESAVSLYRKLGNDERLVCRAPCNQAIDARAGGEFFLDDHNVRFSSAARFDEQRGHVTLSVRSLPDAGLHTAGGILTTVSSIGILLGANLTAIGYIAEGPAVGLFWPGAISLGASVALLPVGVLMVKFGRGRYDMRVSPMLVVPPTSPDLPPNVPAEGAIGGLRGTF